MTELREYRFLTNEEKAVWGDGPWIAEPDKRVWVDDETGFDAMMVRNFAGVWCGYVGVPTTHPAHGVHYFDIEVDVHNGLTYGNLCEPNTTEDQPAICHLELPGRPTAVWWLGFDCAHFRDYAPALVARERALFDATPPDTYIYRQVAYVENEIRDLAVQLVNKDLVIHVTNDEDED